MCLGVMWTVLKDKKNIISIRVCDLGNHEFIIGMEVSYLTTMSLSHMRKVRLINNINQYSAHIYIFPIAH